MLPEYFSVKQDNTALESLGHLLQTRPRTIANRDARCQDITEMSCPGKVYSHKPKGRVDI